MKIIICAFPGVGKTTVFGDTSILPDYTRVTRDEGIRQDVDKTLYDSDSSRFPKDAFPQNYLHFIQKTAESANDVVQLVSTHSPVLAGLSALGLKHAIVFPRREDKALYLKRYADRGSPAPFIDLMDRMWDKFCDDVRAAAEQPNAVGWELASGQYLSAVIEPLIETMVCAKVIEAVGTAVESKSVSEYPAIKLTVGLKEVGLRWLRFSAGEVQVRIQDPDIVATAMRVRIEAKLQSSEAIMTLFMLLDAIEEINKTATIVVYAPYLPYGRQDRVVYPGEAFSLKVFLKLLNSCVTRGRRYDLITLDAHSDVSEKLVTASGQYPYFENIRPWELLRASEKLSYYHYIVAPDAGAMERASDVITKGGIGEALILMSKARDPNTGYLSIFNVETDVSGFDKSQPLLIVDDICDGGRTFIGAAKALRDAGFYGRLGLYVTHGIFSAGFDQLAEAFNEIIVANVMTDKPLPSPYQTL